MALDYFSLGHPLARVRSHFAMQARRRMFETFMTRLGPKPDNTVLDIGVTPETTLPESNFFEALYPYRSRITAISIEDASVIEQAYPGVRFQLIGKGALPFKDNEFDLMFCSAVIEHVGDRAQQRAFVAEAIRVARSFFFTTPNRWFPVDFHTLLPLIHWLPQSTHQRMLRALGHDFLARTENLNLLGAADFLECFPPVSHIALRRQRLFGMTSNLIVYGSK